MLLDNSPDIVRLILVGIAAWRLASFFVYENGPFHVFQRLRKLAGIQEIDGLIIVPEKFTAELLSCILCLSVTTCTIMWVCYDVARPIVLVLCSMVVAIIVDRLIKWR